MRCLAFFVEQHDGEHLVVDEAAEELADALEERIEVEDGGEFDGDFVEHFEGLRLAGDAGVEAGVLNGLGDARGGEGEHVQVLGMEVAGLLLSMSMTPMRRFLAMSGTASSERTSGLAGM